jgi:hypothetical protein
MTLDIDLTWYSWGLGFEIQLPTTSSSMLYGTKLHTYFGFAIYLGPVTITYDREVKIIAFRCMVCTFEHTGEPAAVGPVPNMVICQGCVEKSMGSAARAMEESGEYDE